MKPHLAICLVILFFGGRCGQSYGEDFSNRYSLPPTRLILAAADPKDDSSGPKVSKSSPEAKPTAKSLKAKQAELEKRAAGGEAAAQFGAGVWYADGAGGKTNSFKGYEWLRKAAEQGHVEAQRRVGEMLVDEIGTEGDVEQGLKWLVKAAEKNDVQAQQDLGAIYLRGTVVGKDPAQAFKWYSKAAQAGDKFAQGCLGTLYAKGEGTEKDISKARMWLEKAAVQKNEEAMFNLALACLQPGNEDHKQAFRWLLQAAEAEKADAQYLIAQMYGSGSGVGKDEAKALEWLKRSAQGRYPLAQYQVGIMYVAGLGGEKDTVKGKELLLAAAEAGNSDAQKDLSRAYLAGPDGFPVDYRKAYIWGSTAAVGGHPQAQFILGQMYKDGLGVPEDKIEALKWMQLSANQGFKPAVTEKDIQVVFLSSEERLEVKRRVDAFIPITDRVILTDDSEEAIVPMDDVFRIPVQVFGQTKKFAVDTGAGSVFLDNGFKPKLGKALKEVYVTGLELKKLKMTQYRGPELGIGTTRLIGDTVVVDNFDSLKEAIKGELDGVLGLNYLKKQVITFDPGNGRLIISGCVPEEVRRNGSAVDLEVNGGYYYVRAQIPGGQSIRLMLDSGDIGFMSLKEADWKLIFPKGADEGKPRDFLGAGGRIISGVEASIPAITIGTNVYAEIEGSTSKAFIRSTLGQGFLKRNVVTIDFPNGLLYVMPGKMSVAAP